MKRLVQVDPFASGGINRVFEAGSGLSVGPSGIYLSMSDLVNSGSKFVIEPWREIVKLPPESWLIKKILPGQGLAVIFGRPNSFKSFVAIDIGLSVALGKPWAGHKVQQGDVLYIAAEGASGVRKRIKALKEKIDPELDVSFSLISAAPNFGTGLEDLNALVKVIENSQLKPSLTIIDTASQSIGGADENGSGMVNFVRNTTALSRHFEMLVLVVHHSGLENEKRLRGHSSLHGAVDAQILCETTSVPFQVNLTLQKLKDDASNIRFLAHLSRVVLEVDEDGDEISTLVVDNVELADASTQSTPKSKDIPKQQRLLTEVILHAIEEEGISFRPFGGDGPIVAGVAEAKARRRYYDRLAEQAAPDEKPGRLAGRQQKAFSRAINSMADAKRIVTGMYNGERHLWFP